MADDPLLFFHDTSVLVNFHRPGLVPVLGVLLGRSVRWTATIRTECERKERDLPLPGLTDAASEVLREPLFADGGEHSAIRQLRTQMAAPGDHPDEHLGEAETLTIIHRRRLRAMFVTDDRRATAWADPIECVGTWKLTRAAYRKGHLSRLQAESVWSEFCSAGGYPPFYLSTRAKVIAWLDEQPGA